MSWLTDIARDDIRALRAYEHAAWEPGLIRLNANELPWRSDADTSEAGLNRYPEPHPFALTEALARLYGVESARVLAARGSDEAIDLLIRSYCRAEHDAVLVCPPTFGMYSVAAQVQGAQVISVPLRAADYALDSAALRAQLTPAVKLVFVCSPNNPTGNRLDDAEILQLARELEGRALLVVDEAYVEFSRWPSLLQQAAQYPALVILRTLSKAYGLAGARCGVLVAHADVVALLLKVIQPYAVTQLSIEAVFRALAPASLAQTRSRTATLALERERMLTALPALRRVRTVWPSDANFLLVEFEDAAQALARAHQSSLLIRDMRRSTGREALRISLGTPEQNVRLLESLA